MLDELRLENDDDDLTDDDEDCKEEDADPVDALKLNGASICIFQRSSNIKHETK